MTRAGRIRVVTMLDRVERVGGGETMAIEIARGLDPERFSSVLCATRWSGDEPHTEPTAGTLRDLADAGVEVIGLNRRGKLDLAAWRPLVRRLRDHTDVLHSHMFGSNLWGSVWSRVASVPAFVAHEHMWSFEGGLARRVADRRLIASAADAFLAVSRDAARSLSEVEGIPPAKVRYVPNGIGPEPPVEPAALRRELGVGDAPLVGSIGMLREEKAFEVLIEAAAQLREREPAVRVVIAGEGERRAALEELIARLGLGETVRLLGYRGDPAAIASALDVAVCCSDFEGGPLSVMQYMRAGTPTVATDVGGLPELIDDGVEGVLVPRRDPVALAEATAALLADPARRAELGEAARRRQRADFDISATVRRVEELYEELLGS